MAEFTRGEFKARSRLIRDTLAPLMTRDSALHCVDEYTRADLRAFILSLLPTSIAHKAEIVAAGKTLSYSSKSLTDEPALAEYSAPPFQGLPPSQNAGQTNHEERSIRDGSAVARSDDVERNNSNFKASVIETFIRQVNDSTEDAQSDVSRSPWVQQRDSRGERGGNSPYLISLNSIWDTRLDKAMLEVKEWSPGEPELASLAGSVMEFWEDYFGKETLRRGGLPPNMMMKGRPLEDCWRLKNQNGKWEWAVYRDFTAQAETVGDMGLDVGQWWIHPVGAYRQCVINHPHESITHDGTLAYAILMGQEMQFDRADGLVGVAWPLRGTAREGFNCLLENIRRGIPVRVFRKGSLQHAEAPSCGVRYDGMYSVITWGIIPVGQSGNFGRCIGLSRDQGQQSLSSALVHPLAEERDLWEVFKEERQQQKLQEQNSLPSTAVQQSTGVDGTNENSNDNQSSTTLCEPETNPFRQSIQNWVDDVQESAI